MAVKWKENTVSAFTTNIVEIALSRQFTNIGHQDATDKQV